eukprot:Skav213913  [mRNA]  locus=scaffold1439:232759:233580:- [translate_table: standard]
MGTVCSNAVLSALDKGNKWDLALTFADWMLVHQVETDTCTLNTAVSASGAGWLQAFGMLHMFRLRVAETDSISWSAAVSSCAGSSAWKEASGIMLTMGKANDIARSAAVHSCVAWQTALQLAGKINPLSSSYRAVANALMGNCQKCGPWELPMALLPQLCRPTPRSYTVAITASIEQWPLAANLLQHMKKCNVLPDAVTMNAITSAREWKRLGRLHLHDGRCVRNAAFTRCTCNPAASTRGHSFWSLEGCIACCQSRGKCNAPRRLQRCDCCM